MEAMGLEQSFIDNMRPETLAVIQNSDYITTTVSYAKTDSDGNTFYISEEQANSEIEIIEALKENISVSTFKYGEAQDYDEDEYIRIWHMAVHDTTSESDGTYIFSTAGRWLNMPFIRAWDAVGSSAQNCTYTPYTGYGYIQNDIVHFLAGGNVVSVEQDVVTPISSDDYKDTNNNGWVGAAAVFNLPNDDKLTTMGHRYEDFKAYFEYSGHVTSPTEIAYFNSVGTYSHAEVAITIEPSIELVPSSGALTGGMSIAINAVGTQTERSVIVENYYDPAYNQ